MGVKDYIRLASAGLWRQKRQTCKIIFIMGIMFTFIVTVGFLFWGAKDVGISKINQPTGHDILVYIEDITECKDNCVSENEILKEGLKKYGGEVVERTGSLVTKDGELDALPEEVVERAVEIRPNDRQGDSVPILIPTRTAMEWLKIIDDTTEPTFNANEGIFDFGPEVTIDTIKTAREQVLGKTIVSPNGETYFVVGFLPSNVKTSFTVSSDSGFLNLFIDRTTAGNSKKPIVISDGDKMLDKTNKIWVTFKDVDSLYGYYTNQEGTCDQFNSTQYGCKYTIVSPFGFEFDSKWSYGSTENLFKIVVIVFGTLAAIVNLITLVRITKRDASTEALYYMMGAKPSQIRVIQTLRMLILCLLTSFFVLLIGTVACLVINLIYAGTLAETYALSFGTLESVVILFGWSWEVLAFVGAILIVAPIATVFSWRKTMKENVFKTIKN